MSVVKPGWSPMVCVEVAVVVVSRVISLVDHWAAVASVVGYVEERLKSERGN